MLFAKKGRPVALTGLATLLLMCFALCRTAEAQSIMRRATPEEVQAMHQAMERDKKELERWRVKVERESRQKEWLKVTKNVAALYLAGLLDPMGAVIDEMAKDHPEDQVIQTRAAWLKLAFSLAGSASSAESVKEAVVKFAQARLKGEARKMVLGLIEGKSAKDLALLTKSSDIRGTYNGSGSWTQNNCRDPQDNGSFNFSSVVKLSRETGNTLSGSATLTSVTEGGVKLKTQASFSSAMLFSDTEIRGTFTHKFFINDKPDSSGGGNFSGLVIRRSLSINFSGKDTSGDTCTFNGSLIGTR